MWQQILGAMMGNTPGGRVFSMLGEQAADAEKLAVAQAAMSKALANPFPPMGGGSASPSKSQSTSSSPSSTTKTPGGEEAVDPNHPLAMMQSAIMGKPVFLPGVPAGSPVAKKEYPSAVYTKRSISDGYGGSYSIEPNEGAFQQSSITEHRSHYQTQLKPDGSPKYTPRQVELKSLLGAELATAAEFGTKADPAKLLQIHNELGDMASSFVSSMATVDDLVENGVPWSQIPAILAKDDILPPPEAFEKIQLGMAEQWKARGDQLFANDPAGLDGYYRAVDNRFGISAPPPAARVSDLDPKLQSELASRGIDPTTPISSLGGGSSPFGSDTIEQAHEASRYHERPRITQETTLNAVGSRNLIASGISPMFEIMNRREGADMTGPFDAVKEKIDQYGIPFFSDQDRVALRGYQDALMDILYKMRGKQLAAVEIQKAKHLMPDTKLDEEAFRTQMDVFTNYVMHTAMGNLSTLHRVGIDIGGASIMEVMEYDALREEFPQGFLYDYLGPYIKDEKTGKKQYIVLDEE